MRDCWLGKQWYTVWTIIIWPTFYLNNAFTYVKKFGYQYNKYANWTMEGVSIFVAALLISCDSSLN